MLRVLALLALAAVVLVAGPADAHVGGAERAAFEAPELPAPFAASTPTHFLIAGDAAGFPWPLVLMALLAGATLARQRSRRLVAAGLVLLLAILAVEAAVHSVHHALGREPVACPTASVAAHLDGTTVAAPALDQPIHRVGAVAAASDLLLASLRSLDATHPRAPPTPLV
jgi:hypothetical protein